VKLLIDVNLPKKLAENLKKMGFDVTYLTEVLPQSTKDEEIAKWMEENDALILTKDKRFPATEGGSKIILARLKGIDTEVGYKTDIMPTDIEKPLFTFIVISDVHMGEDFDGGTQDSEYLSWVLNDAYNYIRPAFVVNTGDLTDSTNGGLIPMGGPYQVEWDEYRSIVDPVMSPEIYYDIPGNHDQYSDGNLSYYLEGSMQGRATGSTQYSWFFEADGKEYQFVGVCTAGNDGKPWPIDNAGLDSEELGWINSVIDDNVDMIFFFGHHPLEDLEYGREEFESILRSTPSAYFYGHTHEYGISYYDGHMLVNADSLGKSSENHYLVIEVGTNKEFSVTPYNAYELPQLK